VLADLEYTNSYGSGIRAVGNFYAEVDFLKGFTFKSSLGVDLNYDKAKSFTPVFFVSPQQQNSTSDLNKSYGDNSTWLWENTLSYYKEVGVHRINAVVGYTMQETSSEFINASGQNILRDSPDFWYLDVGNLVPSSISNGVTDDLNYSMISYLFRANYTYNNRYLLTVTYRRDGSSKFTSTNRYADFPSVALGWNVINENFMQDASMISNLKIRGSWGIIGNEKIRYDKQFSSVLNGVGGVFGSGEIYNTGSTYGPSGNPDLQWENTYQTDVGLEFGILEDKLTGEVDYYEKKNRRHSD
jgi:hypothetical protein